MSNHVPIGEHVKARAELHDDARAGFLDSQRALKSRQRLRFDVDDRRGDELHDALYEAQLAVQRFDVAGERGVFGVASVRGGRRQRGGGRRRRGATSVNCPEAVAVISANTADKPASGMRRPLRSRSRSGTVIIGLPDRCDVPAGHGISTAAAA